MKYRPPYDCLVTAWKSCGHVYFVFGRKHRLLNLERLAADTLASLAMSNLMVSDFC